MREVKEVIEEKPQTCALLAGQTSRPLDASQPGCAHRPSQVQPRAYGGNRRSAAVSPLAPELAWQDAATGQPDSGTVVSLALGVPLLRGRASRWGCGYSHRLWSG